MTTKQKNLTLIILILAMVLFYIFSGGSVGISPDFGEDSLILSASDYDWTIPYDQIESLELSDLPDTGTLLDGIEKRTLCCGSWSNERWNEYILCVNPNIDQCIIVTMKDGTIYVLNFENSDSTGQLHKMFTDLLHSKGYLSKS